MTSPDRATVQVYGVRAEADIAVARLAADGIDAVVYQDDEGGLNPGFFRRYGVRVEVDACDLVDAMSSLGIERVRIHGEMAVGMLQHANWAYPDEACGLVAFDAANQPSFLFCLTNAEASDRRFLITPVEFHGALTLAESMGMSIGGVFHSHVRSEAFPSRTDIDMRPDRRWLHFIVGPVSGLPVLRGFRIVDGLVTEVSLVVEA
ncbi:MAG: M67 family metallopeptidase [Acidimicrobiia bacterium]